MRIRLCVVALLTLVAQAVEARVAPDPRPYRVLVVIGDQWRDPGSYDINDERVAGGEFRDVISMLKAWGVPFDILRLDEQNLQINRFLNGLIQPNYGCVIWMADPAKLDGPHADYGTLRRAVEEYGMGLIALFDSVKAPAVSDLVGIRYREYMLTNQWFPEKRFIITGEHPVTAGLRGTVLPRRVNVDFGPDQLGPLENLDLSAMNTVLCEAVGEARVLATLGGYPQIVVRDLAEDVKTVWIGGPHDGFARFPELRRMFRNALTWCLGYGIFNDNFRDAFIMKMDDLGASEHAYSVGWHYPTSTREEIMRYLIRPLEEHDALLCILATPGFVNPRTRMVEVPWDRAPFVDPFGQTQDYASTKAGLDEGLRRGVFEIQAHRAWTHMTPDLDSPPGPWWDAPLEGEMAHLGWYNETYDVRRDKPVTANDMLFVYRVGRDAIERQFGVTPLLATIRSGKDLHTDTGRIAAIAGYGVGPQHYVGHDYTIQLSVESPQVHTFHGLDLTFQPELPRKWIAMHKDRRWMGFNEMCAYLHSDTRAEAGASLTARITYDDHYCRYFRDHASTWTVELSDRLRRSFGGEVSLTVDGRATRVRTAGTLTVTIPPGVGTHTVEIAAP